MAIYTYRCLKCDGEKEVVQSISEYCRAPRIPECCSETMERRLTATLLTTNVATYNAFRSPIDGQFIDSRTKYNAHMRKHGVVPFDELKPDFERNKRRRKQEAIAGVKQAVVEATQRVQAGYKPVVATED